MELEIIKEVDVPLLSRKRITAIAKYEGSTPTNDAIGDKLASMLKVPSENIAIRHIFQKFGKGESKVIAHIYTDASDKNKLEPEYKKAREQKMVDKRAEAQKKAAEAKAAEAAAKAEAAEAPAEEASAEEAAEAPAEAPAEETAEKSE